MAMIIVNGVELPEPTSYNVLCTDLDSSNSGRGEDGYMFRERIRSNIYKVSCKWDNINSTKKNTIMTAIEKQSLTIDFFFDEMVTKEMYAGDKSIELIWKKDSGSIWSMSVNFIEM